MIFLIVECRMNIEWKTSLFVNLVETAICRRICINDHAKSSTLKLHAAIADRSRLQSDSLFLSPTLACLQSSVQLLKRCPATSREQRARKYSRCSSKATYRQGVPLATCESCGEHFRFSLMRRRAGHPQHLHSPWTHREAPANRRSI